MVKLYINGTELTNFILSTPYKDTIDIELDKLNFQFKSQSVVSLSKGDKITYKIQLSKNNTTYDLLTKNYFLFDWVETYEGGFWLYQLTLLSPTKILDNVIINGMADTYPSSNLFQQFTRVVNKINATIKYENTYTNSDTLEIRFPQVVDTDNIGNLVNYPINDFIWDGQLTAREILQDICDKADMILIAKDYEISGLNIITITIDAVKKNKENNKIQNEYNFKGSDISEISDVVKGISYSRDSEFNNGNLISLTKNAICKDNKQTMYLPARNDDLTIDKADTWHILTDEPIYSLNSVYMLANINVVMDVDNEGTDHDYTFSQAGILQLTAQFDITEYIVEKDVFDAMSINEQKKHLYFIRGEKGIYGLYDLYKMGLIGLYQNTAMENIVADINSKIPTGPIRFNNIMPSGYFGCFDSDYKTFTPATSLTSILNNQTFQQYGSVSDIKPENFTYGNPFSYITYNKNFLYSVNYQPYCDSVVKINKTKDNSKTQNLSTIKNQSDRTIDASKYYDSQFALAEKLGQEEMTLDVMYDENKLADYYISNEGTYKDAFYELGDYYGALKTWKLVSREISQYGMDKLKCRLTFSKNFNARNCMINVSRDKRLYGIPLSQYVDRYILIKKRLDNFDCDKVLLSDCYDDFTGSTTTLGFTMLEPTKIGNSTRKDYVCRCKDNYASAIERTKYSQTIVNINVRYTGNQYDNNNGYQENIVLYAMTNLTWTNNIQSLLTDYSRLPFIPYSEIGSAVSNNADLYSLLGIKKDKMERLIFVFIP